MAQVGHQHGVSVQRPTLNALDDLPLRVHGMNITDQPQCTSASAFLKLSFTNEIKLIGQGTVNNDTL